MQLKQALLIKAGLFKGISSASLPQDH